MLANFLALVVGLGSLAIYISAFFFPEIHRKNDFIWSGVGLFYALVLWVFAPRISGGLLLGHIASVALLVWFGWQTLSLRRQLTPLLQQTPVPSSETVKATIQAQAANFSFSEKLTQLQQGIGNVFNRSKNKTQPTGTKKTTAQPFVEIVDKTQERATTAEPLVTVVSSDTEFVEQVIPEAIASQPSTELVADAESEHKQPIAVEEVAPDAVITPSTETPPESAAS